MKLTQFFVKTVSKKNKPAKNRQENFVRKWRGERGQSLVELAMSLTIIMLLLAGAVDFSIAYFSFAALQDAAQEGAMYGSINPGDDAGIKSRVRGASTNPVDLSDDSSVIIDVTVSGDGCEGGEVTVNVSYDYPISMPFIGAIIGTQKIKLNASVTDTILQSEDISLCSGS